MVHAPTARATATVRMLREVLAAHRHDLDLGDLRSDARFDSLQFLHEGAARESSGVVAHRLRHRTDAAAVPDWIRAYDRFDTDYGAGSRLGGPIDRWMDLVTSTSPPSSRPGSTRPTSTPGNARPAAGEYRPVPGPEVSAPLRVPIL